MKSLTEKQKLILKFVMNFIQEFGYPPSCQDISAEFEITRKGAYDHLKAIEKKKYIYLSEGLSRGIRIVRDHFGREIKLKFVLKINF